MRRALAAIAAAGLAGCPSGEVGTLDLDLVTAPGSNLLDSVAELQLTITNPRQVYRVPRTETGFDLSLDLEATGATAALIVEGFDAGGARIAAGQSPPFPFAGIDAHVAIYVAPPMSLGVAPPPLVSGRSQHSAIALSYGAAIAGGVDAEAKPVDTIQIYNAYDHTLTSGLPLPAPRVGLTMAAGLGGGIYLFGGRDATSTATGTLWRFDTTVAPSGAYTILVDAVPELARTDQRAISLGNERYLITGSPVAKLELRQIAEAKGIAAATTGDAVVASDGVVTALLQDETDAGQLHRFRGDAFEPLPLRRPGATIVALSDGRFGLFGEDPMIATIDATTGESRPAGQLASPRAFPVVGVTPRFVAVVGADRSIEVLAADTLARVAILPTTAELDAAIPLSNEQILFVGSALLLFTPPPPE